MSIVANTGVMSDILSRVLQNMTAEYKLTVAQLCTKQKSLLEKPSYTTPSPQKVQ